MFHNPQKVQSLDVSQYFILNSSTSVNVYLHDEGEEFWLWFLLFPMGISTTSIKQPLPGLTAFDLHLSKKEKEVYKRGPNCKHYNAITDFTLCAKKAIHEIIKTNTNCKHHMTSLAFNEPSYPGS